MATTGQLGSTWTSSDWIVTSSSSATWSGSSFHYISSVGDNAGNWYDPNTHFVFEGRVLDKYYQMDKGL